MFDGVSLVPSPLVEFKQPLLELVQSSLSQMDNACFMESAIMLFSCMLTVRSLLSDSEVT